MKKRIFLLLFIFFIPLFSACSFMTGEVHQIDVIETENGQYKINKTEASTDDDIVLDCTPNTGYRFDHIEVNNKTIYDTKFDMPDANVTVKIYFEPVTYIINYAVEENVFSSSPTRSYTIEDEVTNLAAPIKNGYNFDGWYNEPELINRITKINKGTTGDITLYPKFSIKNYTITYHIDEFTENENKTSYNIENPVKLNNPTKEGYIFMGWYNNPEFTGDKITSINAYKNVDLYPMFICNKRDSNGYRIIENELDFKYIFIDEYDENEKYKLTTDIDLDGKVWKPRDFSGEFDGSNHTISNFKISSYSSLNGVGFFSTLNNATIKNLKLECTIDLNIRDNDYNILGIGVVAGEVIDNSKNIIQNVDIINTNINVTSTQGLAVGGIIGIANQKTTINGCNVTNLNINANSNYASFIGGISGRYGNISLSSVTLDNTNLEILSTAKNSDTVVVAGIIGQGDKSTIENCYFVQKGSSKLKINQKNSNTINIIAGIIGDTVFNSQVNNCYALLTEFEFIKNKSTKDLQVYLIGLAAHGHVSNSFVACANEKFIYTTKSGDSYITPYNDPYNEYYIAYLSMVEPINCYVQYADIYVNNNFYLEDKIHDYHRITTDLQSTLFNIFKDTWSTSYWTFSPYKLPTLKN